MPSPHNRWVWGHFPALSPNPAQTAPGAQSHSPDGSTDGFMPQPHGRLPETKLVSRLPSQCCPRRAVTPPPPRPPGGPAGSFLLYSVSCFPGSREEERARFPPSPALCRCSVHRDRRRCPPPAPGSGRAPTAWPPARAHVEPRSSGPGAAVGTRGRRFVPPLCPAASPQRAVLCSTFGARGSHPRVRAAPALRERRDPHPSRLIAVPGRAQSRQQAAARRSRARRVPSMLGRSALPPPAAPGRDWGGAGGTWGRPRARPRGAGAAATPSAPGPSGPRSAPGTRRAVLPCPGHSQSWYPRRRPSASPSPVPHRFWRTQNYQFHSIEEWGRRKVASRWSPLLP